MSEATPPASLDRGPALLQPRVVPNHGMTPAERALVGGHQRRAMAQCRRDDQPIDGVARQATQTDGAHGDVAVDSEFDRTVGERCSAPDLGGGRKLEPSALTKT